MLRRVPGGRAFRPVLFAMVAVSAGAAPAAAQYPGGGTKTAVETQVADLEQMRDKFLAPAEPSRPRPTAGDPWRGALGAGSPTPA